MNQYQTEEEKFEFITAFRELMRLLNVLKSFSDFSFDQLEMTEFEFDGYKSKYLDIWQTIKPNATKDKVSILDDIDFELELIHRDEINVRYILSLLANLKESNEEKRAQKIKEIKEIISGDVQLRSKKELIEKFIDENLPNINDSESVNDEFETFWNKEKVEAFERIAAEESLNKEKFQDTINDFLFTAKTPKISEALKLLEIKPKITERNNIGKRIIQKVQDFVNVFIDGVEG